MLYKVRITLETVDEFRKCGYMYQFQMRAIELSSGSVVILCRMVLTFESINEIS